MIHNTDVILGEIEKINLVLARVLKLAGNQENNTKILEILSSEDYDLQIENLLKLDNLSENEVILFEKLIKVLFHKAIVKKDSRNMLFDLLGFIERFNKYSTFYSFTVFQLKQDIEALLK